MRLYPPIRVAIAVRTLVSMGAPLDDLLHGCDLSPADLEDPECRVSSLQLLGVLRNGVALGLSRDMGLRVGQQFHASCYGMLGYALLCAPTMRSTFDTGQRFYRLGNGMFDAQWQESEGVALWRFSSQDLLGLPDTGVVLANVIRDLSLASLITIFKDVMGPWLQPRQVCLSGPPPEPVHCAAMQAAFGCPLTFHHEHNEVHYPADWLERAPQLANPITAAQVSGECLRLLEQWSQPQGDTTRRVIQELTRNPGRFPPLEALASSLCMTSRTLRRKLVSENTSYSALLDEVRLALARDYLRTQLLSMDDIASALGFGDTASFRRAYKRWTGEPPGVGRSR